MKNLITIITVFLFFTNFNYAQKSQRTTSGIGGGNVIQAIELDIEGETNCCNTNQSFDYDVSLSGGWLWGRHWSVWVTNGEITHVDGNPYAGNNGDQTEWFHSAGDAKRDYTFTIIWDDNESGLGKLRTYVSYQKFGIPPWGSRDETIYTYIGAPKIPAYLNVSDATPYPGQTITCTTADQNLGGITSLVWGHTGSGSYQGSGYSVNYTPNSSGSQTLSIRGTNVCGQGPKRYKNIQVQQYAPLNVNITGPIWANNYSYYTWTGTVSGGAENFNYVWYYSYDGQNYNSIWSSLYNTSNHTHSVTAQMPNGLDLYLKLVVTDGLGNQDIDYFQTFNGSHKSSGTNDWEVQSEDNSKTVQASLDVGTIYPNPTDGFINFGMDYISNFTHFRIYSSSGKLMEQQMKLTNEHDISSYTNGLYFIELLNSKSNNKKIIKIMKK